MLTRRQFLGAGSALSALGAVAAAVMQHDDAIGMRPTDHVVGDGARSRPRPVARIDGPQDELIPPSLCILRHC
jgi:hypothetical protein